MRDELNEALKRIDLAKVKLYANLTPVFWKISHGTDWITDAEAATFDKRRVVVVHKDTAAKGKTKVSQGEDFVANMKKATSFICAVEIVYGSFAVLIQMKLRRIRKNRMDGVNAVILSLPSHEIQMHTLEKKSGGRQMITPPVFPCRKVKKDCLMSIY